jgi:ABC-type Fe3+-hydroxamate transport system substrate-binding protein
MIFLDQLNRAVKIPKIPKRIISLVPSQTELLYDLGLGEKVVGITKFCIHPQEWFKTKTRIGGTKDFKADAIRALRPDLIIANKEENTKDGLEELADICPIWISNIKNVDEALGMIRGIGLILDKIDEAEKMVSQIQAEREKIINKSVLKECSYLIWKEPYMTVGGDTFINDLLLHAGFENVYKNLKRYPSVSLNDLKKNRSEYILLSSEPYPFREKHQLELEKVTGKKVVLVDGEMFSWYGSRLLKSWRYFTELEKQL